MLANQNKTSNNLHIIPNTMGKYMINDQAQVFGVKRGKLLGRVNMASVALRFNAKQKSFKLQDLMQRVYFPNISDDEILINSDGDITNCKLNNLKVLSGLKIISDVNPKYMVSRGGDVYVKGGKTGSIRLKTFIRNNGYEFVTLQLTSKSKPKHFNVHRLVALNFVENPDIEKLDQVNHIDGDKLNNDYTNLEWSNASLNQIHATKMGLNPSKRNSPLSKLDVDDIKFLSAHGFRRYFIAKLYSRHITTIDKVINGKHYNGTNKPRSWGSLDDLDIILEMRDEGVTINNIAKHLNCHISTIFRKLRKYNENQTNQ